MLPVGLLFAGFKLLQKAIEHSDRDAASVATIELRTSMAPPEKRAEVRQHWINYRQEIVAQLKGIEERQKAIEFYKVVAFWVIVIGAFSYTITFHPGAIDRVLFEGLPKSDIPYVTVP